MHLGTNNSSERGGTNRDEAGDKRAGNPNQIWVLSRGFPADDRLEEERPRCVCQYVNKIN